MDKIYILKVRSDGWHSPDRVIGYYKSVEAAKNDVSDYDIRKGQQKRDWLRENVVVNYMYSYIEEVTLKG